MAYAGSHQELERQWDRWARTRKARMAWADWQAIYPELEALSFNELRASGTTELAKRTGRNDDEILLALIALAQAGDQEAGWTVLRVLASRIHAVCLSLSGDPSSDGQLSPDRAQLFDASVYANITEMLMSLDLAQPQSYVGRNLCRDAKKRTTRQDRKSRDYWIYSEGARPLVRPDSWAAVTPGSGRFDDSDHGDGWSVLGMGSERSAEDEAIEWLHTAEVLGAIRTKRDGRSITQELFYEMAVKDADIATAVERVGISGSQASASRRYKRARESLAERYDPVSGGVVAA